MLIFYLITVSPWLSRNYYYHGFFSFSSQETLTIIGWYLPHIDQFEKEDPEWEKKSAKIFVRKKKLENSNENKQKNLSKMARAGFSYDISKEILEKI